MKRNSIQSVLWWRNKVISILFLAILTLFASCVPDSDSPTDDPVEKFTGDWQVSDLPARINYEVSIQKDPGHASYVLLQNFADMGGSASGLVVGNHIIIEKQDVGNGFFSTGSGTYHSKYELEFEFTLDDGIDIESRKAVYTR